MELLNYFVKNIQSSQSVLSHVGLIEFGKLVETYPILYKPYYWEQTSRPPVGRRAISPSQVSIQLSACLAITSPLCLPGTFCSMQYPVSMSPNIIQLPIPVHISMTAHPAALKILQ